MEVNEYGEYRKNEPCAEADIFCHGDGALHRHSLLYTELFIRSLSSLYALSYLFPFLVLPLGLANFISNMLFGGFGIVDMLGGCIVGIVAASCIVLIRRRKWNRIFIAVPIVLVPGLGVATYLSYFLAIPYPLMAMNLCIGQIVPAIVGVALVKALERVWRPAGSSRAADRRRADS